METSWLLLVVNNSEKSIFKLRQGVKGGGRGVDGGVSANWRGVVESDSRLSKTSSRLFEAG